MCSSSHKYYELYILCQHATFRQIRHSNIRWRRLTTHHLSLPGYSSGFYRIATIKYISGKSYVACRRLMTSYEAELTASRVEYDFTEIYTTNDWCIKSKRTWSLAATEESFSSMLRYRCRLSSHQPSDLFKLLSSCSIIDNENDTTVSFVLLNS